MALADAADVADDDADADADVGHKDIVSVVLPTKEQQPQQQDYNNDEQFESLPAAAAAGVTSSSSSSSSSLLAVSSAQQSSTNIHLQAVNQRQLRVHCLSKNCAFLFLSELHQISTDFNKIW